MATLEQPNSPASGSRNIFGGLVLTSLMTLAGCADAERVKPTNAVKASGSDGPPLVRKVGTDYEGYVLRTEGSVMVPNVARVFMHEPGKYSILAKEGNELISYDLRELQNSSNSNFAELLGYKNGGISKVTSKLITDVKPGENMYAYIEYSPSRCSDYFDCKVFIHVRDASDIDSANWKEKVGKSTKDRTTNVVK